MNISLIIPTLNAAPHLESLLSKLRAQVLQPMEIIIIDSTSEDNTVEIARGHGTKTIIIPREHFGHGKTRNRAAREATGEVIVFMTQDALPFDGTLMSHLVSPLAQDDIAASYGRQVPRPDASPVEQFARRFNYPEEHLVKGIGDVERLGIKTFFMSNVCSAFKRLHFFEAGAFSESVSMSEDMVMAARLILKGYKVAYVPRACVYHSHDYSLAQQFRRYYSIGSSLKNNRWILSYGRSEGEGSRYLKEEVNFIFSRKQYRWIPYVFFESLAKYAGYRIGLIAG